ncbi:hypothetical protein PHLGIDRAFT_328284 [Phlebiopsis gigantea 11061_1 CR5-6]|uniref:Uncharacterized protein n=1 Tax=Phlebiopsis gigantea (strain 11061_1 CR5-6) TaxID=745531 RepID=A0A0C3P2W3_PHLG1|nr:hypothetical protein PHLGIDRAFT_328284 [Phlebiopsis gigantea 11061_1 CR5-6]
MGLTNSTLGAAFIGSYVNTALYGALCVQSLEFFRRFKDDRRSLNYSVLFIWIINTVRVALQGHMIYKHLLLNGFEDKIVASDVPWSAITSCLLTFISSTFIQSHYCYRVWKMSGRDRRIITPLMLAMHHCYRISHHMCYNANKLHLCRNFLYYRRIVFQLFSCLTQRTR